MTKETKYNHMNIKGKVIEVESYGEGEKKKYKHQIVTAAKDEFSRPAGIIVTSNRMMAMEGQIVECEAEYGGYVKVNKWIDQKTGEQKEMKNLVAYFTEIPTSGNA